MPGCRTSQVVLRDRLRRTGAGARRGGHPKGDVRGPVALSHRAAVRRSQEMVEVKGAGQRSCCHHQAIEGQGRGSVLGSLGWSVRVSGMGAGLLGGSWVRGVTAV